MTVSKWAWVVPEVDEEAVKQLRQQLGIHRLTAAALYQRGLHTPQEAQAFLRCDLSDLGDPFSMAGAAAAAVRIAAAIERKERILIFGDYDADGITATALLMRALQNLGADVAYYIPSRFTEGYGLQAAVLEEYAAAGFQLVITVDCGINSFAEMEAARQLGLDLIITDHHTCFPGIRTAMAVLNPKQAACSYPEKQLAGVGVAWTLVRALYATLELPPEAAYQFLDLVAVGTIADVVPLVGENRILVKHGLARLSEKPLPGLAALMQVSGSADAKLTAMQVAFTLAPRLNAAGRLEEADPAVETLLAGPAEAEAGAKKLDALNRRRQQIEIKITAEARVLADAQADAPALVLWQEGWHPGVIGIAAGRLAREFNRPVALIALEGAEGRGSIRSVPGCNVVAALQACAEHLLKFGGHAEAAGLTIAAAELEAFRQAFSQAVAAQEYTEPALPVVAETHLAELTLALAEELESLAPFGQGNSEPVFLIKGAEILQAQQVGAQGDHLRLTLKQEAVVQNAIYFGAGEQRLNKDERQELIVLPGVNQWQGRTLLSLQVKDMRPAAADSTPVIVDQRHKKVSEQWLVRLAGEKKLLIWVNTKAAKTGLEKLLGRRAEVTQLGRRVDYTQTYDALLFYHLPYQRKDLEQLLQQLSFSYTPQLYLCYGAEEAALNEKIFAATVPAADTLQQLAGCVSQAEPILTAAKVQGKLRQQVTHYLIKEAQVVFKEIAAGQCTTWPPQESQLQQSPTYRRYRRVLARFRAYQDFWLRATADEITAYFLNPEQLALEEEEI
ncbi:MAG: single-stranded-DNA-specific exonuclease RecJ [Dethiobacteraceae bacterium]|jgi:single-stranded-DNA-specific exonuclease|nr:single-stranded-DNA-specific exonuclease RecJ [Bacillota bacterium]